MKASFKQKNRKTTRSCRRTRRFPPFDITPVLHPHKIEIRILWRSAYLLDPEGFAGIRSMMENEMQVKWRRPTQPESLSKWNWFASNDDFRITFIGTTAHLEDRTAWLSKPFPSSEDLSNQLRWWWYIGAIRLTSKTHDPALYLMYVSRFFELIERAGIYETPGEIEIACDVPNNPEGRRLAMCARLKRDSACDLVHFRAGHDNRAFEGPSRDGLAEYSNFWTYPADDRLQLCVYPSKYVRAGTDEIRIELRIGPRKLREILRSTTLLRLMESTAYPLPDRSYGFKTISPTLNILSFIEYYFRQNVIVQDIDEEKLRQKFPLLRHRKLSSFSVRGKRFTAFSSGLTPRQLESCTIRGHFPPMQVLYPTQYEEEPE